MTRARDLRRASLRSALLVAPAVGLCLALGDSTLAATWAAAGALLVPVWLVELRATGRADQRREPNEPFLVWLLSAAASVLLFVEYAYVDAAVRTRSLDRGVVAAWEVVRDVGRAPFGTFVGLLLITCPFALAAHVRLRGFEPRSTVFLAAFLLLLPSGCMSFGVAVPVAFAAVYVLVGVYAVADRIDEVLFDRPSRAERDAFDAETADVPWGRLWLLAYLDHAPARHALGRRAPEAPRDLDAFVLGLEPAGREAAVRAAAVAAGLAAPFLGDDPTPRAILAAVDACAAAPSAERREAARALGQSWAPADEVAGGAVRDAIAALDGEPPWATRAAIRAAARAAHAAARLMDDPAAAREGIRAGLLAWALEARTSPPATARGAAPEETTEDERRREQADVGP